MKKILLPTDHSANAKNAIRYALEMFGREVYPDEVTFILLSVLPVGAAPIPASSTYAAAAYVPAGGRIAEHKKSLQTEVAAYQKEFPGLVLEEMMVEGGSVPAITGVAKDEKVDLIVMGNKGKTGLERVIMGSTSIGVAQQAPCPVMIVPKNASFNEPERILFATDFNNLEDLNILTALRDLVQVYDPQFFLLHVYSEKETSGKEKERMSQILNAYFGTLSYQYYFLEHNNTVEGIEEFLSGYRADMLALVGQERGFFEQLFHKSVTKQMILHAEVPIFVLNHYPEEKVAEPEKPFRERATDQINHWKAEVDEMNVQLHLGKAEMGDEFEKQKKRIRDWANEGSRKISALGNKVGAYGTKIKGALEDLQIQLSLGKAETEEGLEKQKEKINQALHNVQDKLKEGRKAAKDKTGKVAENLEDTFTGLRGRIDMLFVQMNLAKKELGDELEPRREKARKQLQQLQAKLQDAEKVTEQKWKHFREEVSEAFQHVKKAIMGKG